MSKKESPITTTSYAKQIIKVMEQIYSLSGHRPYQIFDDFVRIAEATLEALPAHMESVFRDGRLAKDTLEVTELFGQIRSRYEDRFDDIWQLFGQALGLLLESTALGLNNSRWHLSGAINSETERPKKGYFGQR
jgi:hypothetical protein